MQEAWQQWVWYAASRVSTHACTAPQATQAKQQATQYSLGILAARCAAPDMVRPLHIAATMQS